MVGYPTAEADTVRVYLDRWTLTRWEEVEFCELKMILEKPLTDSHIPLPEISSGQDWVRRLALVWSDGLTRSKNRVAVKAERR